MKMVSVHFQEDLRLLKMHIRQVEWANIQLAHFCEACQSLTINPQGVLPEANHPADLHTDWPLASFPGFSLTEPLPIHGHRSDRRGDDATFPRRDSPGDPRGEPLGARNLDARTRSR